MSVLEVVDLHVRVENKEILKGLNLTVKQGETHALMGPNGSGKTSLAYVLLGHPRYVVTGGDIKLDGESVLRMRADQRAKLGLFLGFQYPVEVPGLRLGSFLRSFAVELRNDKTPLSQFYAQVKQLMAKLEIDESFLSRSLNEGFSGGEKKRAEILQLAIAKPKFAILDETDSGLDVDALKAVSDMINTLRGPEIGFVLITHYLRILKYTRPDYVHVLVDGRVAKSGDMSLAEEIEKRGYEALKELVSPT